MAIASPASASAPATAPATALARTPSVPAPGYFVFYDAQCRLCAGSRRTIERLRPTTDVTFVDVQDPVAMERFPMVDRAAGLRQMFVLDPAGRLAGGYDGFVALLPALRLLRPLRHVMRLPPVRAAGRRAYAWVARNRYRLGGRVSCEDGACRIRE
jgi:predicted DCC family thiol-disulfide oxidoreductase YuxK